MAMLQFDGQLVGGWKFIMIEIVVKNNICINGDMRLVCYNRRNMGTEKNFIGC